MRVSATLLRQSIFVPFKKQIQKQVEEVPQIMVKAGSEYEKTGLTGIYQHPNPKPALQALYGMTLDLLQHKFPEYSIYRQSVENLTKQRLAIIENNDITEVIEEKIGNGLIEEVIIQAHDEYELAKDMAEAKCWEDLQDKPLDDQWVYFGKRV
ncbi:hypothetical protein BABINDRAFT_160295 [Babjeviella inositovora NRRL Y-12698]|uniref:NADH dehydrogenase [ubiquinone] 1 alpha subcomplex subunit 5 n=1 Tax=Babjeviella inositovora NRRL Y-12698 TaxID=984486 RepID=A0A1E3QWM8_9ASCO|nr:uncharacterized protein BABINDRAFT_160295 [Babjeviella inositovora NRRL Y-12698]ODQ82099.1 hypothetical protein BABINDRAFT_160295 [Babjeviella inositovora NRRL Y-12698]